MNTTAIVIFIVCLVAAIFAILAGIVVGSAQSRKTDDLC